MNKILKTNVKSRTILTAIVAWTIGLGVVAVFAAVMYTQSRPIMNSGISYDTLPEVELKMPGYLGEGLRHPQKYFAGRKITIAKDAFVKATLQYAKGSSRINKELQSTETKGDRLVFELPMNLPEKSQLKLLLKNSTTQRTETKNLNIYNPKPPVSSSAKKSMKISQTASNIKDGWILSNKYLNLKGGFEMVMAGQPNNSQNLIINSENNVLRTTNGWESWSIDQIDGNTRKEMDGDLDIDINGNFVLPGLFLMPSPKDQNVVLAGGGIHFGNVSGGSLTSKVIKDTGGLDNLTKEILLDNNNTIFDYPRVARYNNDVYVSVNGLYFNTYGRKTGMLISTDGGLTFKEYKIESADSIKDMEVDASGSRLYAVTTNDDGGGAGEHSLSAKLIIFDKAANTFIYKNIDKTSYTSSYGWLHARVSYSQLSGQVLVTYKGPVIAIDKTNSLYKGRIYVAYAKPEKDIFDLNVEYKTYGYNFDIFLVYSDDKGDHWSDPIKVNDDAVSADQYFPSMSIDEDGVLHMSFMDHRDDLSKGEVNLYYTYSKDGGKTFAPNIRIGENPTPIYIGGFSTLGDYSYNLVAYRNKVYFGYPCLNPNKDNSIYLPNDMCLSTLELSRRINLSVNSGITVISGSGNINCSVSGENCSATYPINMKVILTAVTAIPGKIKWTGECVVSSNATNDDTCTINSLDADKNITATFTSSQPPSAPSSLSKNYDPTWTVTVTAPANSITDPENDKRTIECFKNEAKEPISISSGESSLLSKIGPWTYAFMIPWGSNDTSSHVIYCFSKDEVGAYSTSYKAIDVGLALSSYTVTVSPNSNLIRYVRSIPGGMNCDQSKIGSAACRKSFLAGTKVTLTATHTVAGSVTWAGGCVGSGDTCVIKSLNGDKNVVATFAPYLCTVNIAANKSSIVMGKPLYLAWNTSNAVSCTSQRYPSDATRWIDSKSQSLRNSQHIVSPINKVGTYIYTLNCKNIAGSVCSGSTTVSVTKK